MQPHSLTKIARRPASQNRHLALFPGAPACLPACLLISRFELSGNRVTAENERSLQAEAIPQETTLSGVGEIGIVATTVLLGTETDTGATGGAMGYA